VSGLLRRGDSSNARCGVTRTQTRTSCSRARTARHCTRTCSLMRSGVTLQPRSCRASDFTICATRTRRLPSLPASTQRSFRRGWPCLHRHHPRHIQPRDPCDAGNRSGARRFAGVHRLIASYRGPPRPVPPLNLDAASSRVARTSAARRAGTRRAVPRREPLSGRRRVHI
jgi:hypothetical protein